MLSVLSLLHARTAALEQRLGMYGGDADASLITPEEEIESYMRGLNSPTLSDDNKTIFQRTFNALQRVMQEDVDILIQHDFDLEISSETHSSHMFTIVLKRIKEKIDTKQDRQCIIYGFALRRDDVRPLVHYIFCLHDMDTNIKMYYRGQHKQIFNVEFPYFMDSWLTHGLELEDLKESFDRYYIEHRTVVDQIRELWLEPNGAAGR